MKMEQMVTVKTEEKKVKMGTEKAENNEMETNSNVRMVASSC